MATHNGKAAEQLVKDAALRLLKTTRALAPLFIVGLEAADRGDFIEEEAMDARIEQMLQS
jgi:hypothetical protein